MKARYAGTCARTGQSYKVGTEIKKGSKGWEIAGALGNTIEIRSLASGSRMSHDLSRKPLVCGACAKADPSYDQTKAAQLSYRPEFQLAQDGDTFVCPTCGEMKAVVCDTEAEWEHYIHLNLQFSAGGELNLKIGPARWEKVKQYFEYISYADLADMHDQMDDFDLAEQYEGMRGGFWSLKDLSNMATVEDILDILPENRRAALDAKEAQERMEEAKVMLAAQAEKTARTAEFARLFNRIEGEYVADRDAVEVALQNATRLRVGEGFNIYGVGEELRIQADGQAIWLCINNGMDGDDWSRNNVRTGGAGAIGYRFPLTAERLQFVRTMPGGEWLQYSETEKRAKVLAILRDKALRNTPEDFAAHWTNPLDARDHEPAIWIEWHGLKIGVAIDRSRIYLKAPHPHLDNTSNDIAGLWDAFHDCKFQSCHNVSCTFLHFEATPERMALLEPLFPAWVGTAEVGRFSYGRGLRSFVAENAVEAVRGADWDECPINSVQFTPGATIVLLDKKLAVWSDGVVSRFAPLGLSLKSVARSQQESEQRNRERAERGEAPLAVRAPREFKGLPELPSAPPVAGVEAAAARLLHIALTQPEWRAEDKYQKLFAVTEYRAEQIDQSSKRSTGTSLEKLICKTSDEGEMILHRVNWNWGCMGEDGDADEETTLHEDLSEARAQFKEFAAR